MRLSPIVCFMLGALPLGAAEPILNQTFAADAGGWTAVGEGTVAVTAGNLVFRYNAAQGAPAFMALPVPGLPMSEFRSLRLDLRTDIPIPVAVILSEKKPGGGNYLAVVWSKGNEWTLVQLSPADFAPSDGPNDPVDADGQLDTADIQGIAVVDLSQIFGGAPVYTDPRPGPHTISLRSFEIARDAATSSDTTIQWLASGGVSFEQNEGTLTARFAELPHELLGARFMAITRLMPPGSSDPAATHLALDVSSSRPAQLVISIRERRADGKEGARFNSEFFVPAGPVEHRELALSALVRDESGPDGTLDPERIQSITFLDVSGDTSPNTLTIHGLRMVKH